MLARILTLRKPAPAADAPQHDKIGFRQTASRKLLARLTSLSIRTKLFSLLAELSGCCSGLSSGRMVA
jgi:hypothetical protein